MGIFLNYAINGIAYGLILFLIATGMTLTMGLLRVVNMSHGAIFMISGYFGAFVFQLVNGKSGISDVVAWIIAIVAAGLLAGLLGLGIELGFLRPLYASPMSQVLLTIGLINILTNVSLWIFGGTAMATPVPSFLTDNGISIGGVRIPYLRFFIIIVGVIAAIALWLMQEKTSIGAKVRAGMDNGVIAGTMGLNKKALFLFIFVLGSAIAGVSSIVGGSVLTIDQNTGWNVLLNSIIVVVIGGSGSIPGALIGGVLLGIVNQFGVWLTTDVFGKMKDSFLHGVSISSFLIYLVLIIVLVIRPQGLMGRKIDIDKASDDYSSTKAIEKPRFTMSMLGNNITVATKTKLTGYKLAPYIFFLALAVVLPFVTTASTQNILSEILIYALFAASLDVVMGYTGNRSFGHAAYFGLGAYVVVLMNKLWGISSLWINLGVTILLSAIVAAIIGYFTLKLTGTNFLLVTMAFGQLLSVVATQFKDITGGTDGENLANKPNLGLSSNHTEFWNNWFSGENLNLKIYFMILIFVVICFLILHRFMRASFGSSLKGVKGNEGRMRALGFNTWQLRYTAVIIAGIFAGIAGMLYSYRFKTVTPRLFAIEKSAMPMLMVIIGGGSTLWGPMIGAAIIVLVQNYANILLPDRWQMILGLIYVICVIFLNNGFAPMLKKFWNWVGYKLFKKDFVTPEPKKSIREEATV